MKYRQEIDGLRALAVLPVILFHAGSSLFTGGFLGVDVFFVISGYLIIGLIMEDLARGSFSLRAFYARRARRILPALYVMVIACIPLAYLWLLPSQHLDFSQSLLALLLFGSNILFWRERGYFAPDVAEKPLLHTWSLSVEEQFYILIPILLVMVWRYARKHFSLALVVGLAVSFVLCEYASRTMPAANFFLLPTRAWELFVGGFCAWLHHRYPMKQSDLLGMLGLGMILASLIFFHGEMRLPSVLSLVPVIGTALVLLYASSGTHVARLLSLRPLVAAGLVSYSAYLWHHPMLAYARVLGLSTESAGFILGVLVVTFLLAALSWRYIEQPFRNQRHPAYVSNRRAWWCLGVALFVIAGAGLHGQLTQGRVNMWMAHAPASQVRAYELLQAALYEPRYYDNGDCVFNVSKMKDAEQKRLKRCAETYGPGIAIIGDSHAINLFFIMKNSAPKEKFLIGVVQGMCRPHDDDVMCYYRDLRGFLETNPRIFGTILYTQAGFYLLKDRFGKAIERGDLAGVPLDRPWPTYHIDEARMMAVKQYLEKLAVGSRVIWIGPHVSPHVRGSVVVRMGCDADFQLRPNQVEPYEKMDKAISETLKGSVVEYRSQLPLLRFDMSKDFMNCETTYFMDGDHNSIAGEKRFAERLTLKELLKKP